MAWGLWNKIKKGLKKAVNWVKNKIIKPVKNKIVKPVWNKVVKPVTNVIGKVPGIENLPGKVGIVGKVAKGINQFTPVIDNILK